MKSRPYRLDQILEAAVISHWSELMPEGEKGLIHFEYDFADNSTVNYFQIWSSILHGYWRLVCTYRAPAANDPSCGVRFENTYGAKTLAELLKLIMQHQEAFSPAVNLGRQGLLQITTPSQIQTAEAEIRVHEALRACNLLEKEWVVA